MSPVETRNRQTPDSRSSPAISVRIDSAKRYSKNTLIAFVDFTLIEAGLSIKGASLHEKEGSRCVSMPSRSYSHAQGTHWAHVVEFTSKESRSRINDAVLAAFEEYAATEGGRQ